MACRGELQLRQSRQALAMGFCDSVSRPTCSSGKVLPLRLFCSERSDASADGEAGSFSGAGFQRSRRMAGGQGHRAWIATADRPGVDEDLTQRAQ